jgi:hypothetical protein
VSPPCYPSEACQGGYQEGGGQGNCRDVDIGDLRAVHEGGVRLAEAVKEAWIIVQGGGASSGDGQHGPALLRKSVVISASLLAPSWLLMETQLTSYQ